MEEIKYFTLKELSGIVGIPQRRIQFYILQNFITPDLEVSTGRGVAHKFSFSNVVELFFIKELNDLGVALSVIKKIFDAYMGDAKPIGNKSISVGQLFVIRETNDATDPEMESFNRYFLISNKEGNMQLVRVSVKTKNSHELEEEIRKHNASIIINITRMIRHIYEAMEK